MPYSLAIFDLDGTLADSFPWFLTHLNDVADRFGFRCVAGGDVEMLRHMGPREILAHLGVPIWRVPAIARHMRALKAKHIDEIALFPGCAATLNGLAASGVTLGLVSSDDEINVRRQLGASAAYISHFACGASLFGKAAKFSRVVREASIAPQAAIAIGDEVRDIEAAREARIACGAVTWGYGAAEALKAAGPDHILARIDDIPRVIVDEPRG